MWFFQTENGTFCIRYMREGYGLFIDQDFLCWYRDADTAARAVTEHRTGHRPWDGDRETDGPDGLAGWLPLEEMRRGELIKPALDPVVVSLDCDCGHQVRESVKRIRTISVFRCPQCDGEIRVDGERLREIIETVNREYPDGYIRGVTKRQ